MIAVNLGAGKMAVPMQVRLGCVLMAGVRNAVPGPDAVRQRHGRDEPSGNQPTVEEEPHHRISLADVSSPGASLSAGQGVQALPNVPRQRVDVPIPNAKRRQRRLCLEQVLGSGAVTASRER